MVFAHKLNFALLLLAGAGLAATPAVHAQNLTLGQQGSTLLAGMATLADTGTTVTGTHEYAYGNGVPLAQQNNFNEWNAYGSSTATLVGGSTGYLVTHDTSTAAISGGSVYFLNTDDASTAIVNGGSVNTISSFNTSQVNFTGGATNSLSTHDASVANISSSAGILTTYDNSSANVSGGTTGIQTYGSSTVNFTSGSSGFGNFDIYDASTLNVSGGSIFEVDAQSTSTVNVSGGSVRALNTFALGSIIGGGTVNITGGSLQYLNADAASIFNITGGNLQNLSTSELSTINLFGTGFTQTLLQTNPSDQVYSIAGTLQNGDTLNAQYSDYGGTLNFITPAAVPEASSVISLGALLALGLGGYALNARRRSAPRAG